LKQKQDGIAFSCLAYMLPNRVRPKQLAYARLGDPKDSRESSLAQSAQFLCGNAACKSIRGDWSFRIYGVIDLKIGIVPQVLPKPASKILTDLWLLFVAWWASCCDKQTFQVSHVDRFLHLEQCHFIPAISVSIL